jgi:hypothetical protein
MPQFHPHLRNSSSRRTQTSRDLLVYLTLETESADNPAADWSAQFSLDGSELMAMIRPGDLVPHNIQTPHLSKGSHET